MRFVMVHSDGQRIADRPAMITDAVAGDVEAFLQDGETDRCGLHRIEWKIMLASGHIRTIPTSGFDSLVLTEQIF